MSSIETTSDNRKNGQNTERCQSAGDCQTAEYGRSRFSTKCAFFKNGTCSKTLFTVLNREFTAPMEVEEQATHPLAGGLMQGYQCGMLWGASLAAGAQAHRLYGATPQAEAKTIAAAQSLRDSFRSQNDHINCLEITDTDPNDNWQVLWYFLFKGGSIRCASRAADFAPKAFHDINRVLQEDHGQTTCNPVSCATKLAKKMGASDKHATMAAGLAGGIGLSGGACGALGAAIWLIGIEGINAGAKNKVQQEKISQVTEAFLKTSSYEYECSEIVGRKFDDIDDHASHVHSGGCAEIIDALAVAATAAISDMRKKPAGVPHDEPLSANT